MSQWLVAGNLLFGGIRQIKEGISNLVSIDTALIGLKKVTNETDEVYKQFVIDVNQVAKEVGHTTQAAIDATTSFAKLGYTISESAKLAKQALIYSNIGDISIEDATKSIISTMSAYGDKIKSVTQILDVANEVGNNWKITTGGIGEALQRSASALESANNSYEQSVALITTANSAIQNTSKVGTALKTISMRLRGINEESGEAIPKLRETIKLLTGVDIMKDENTFKSTYEIIKLLQPEYDKLSDKNRAYLQELIAGKQQGNIFASLMKNAKDLDNVYATAMNSFGSSAREQERYMASIDAKVNKFKESMKSLFINAISTDSIKGVVDTGTALVTVLDKIVKIFGGIPTIVGMGTLGLSLFNREFRNISNGITKTIPVIGNFDAKLINLNKSLSHEREGLIRGREALLLKIQTAKQAGQTTDGYGKSLSAVRGKLVAVTLQQYAAAAASAALEAALTMGLSIALTAIISGIDYLIHKEEKMKEKTTELIQSVNENIKMNNDNINSLRQLADEYESLSAKTILTSQEQDRFNEVSNEMARLSPSLVQAYDSQGNAILNYKGNVEELIEKLKEKNKIENMKLIQGGDNALEVMRNDVDKAMGKITRYNLAIKMLQEGIHLGDMADAKGLKELNEELDKIPDKSSSTAQSIINDINRIENNIRDYQQKIEIETDIMNTAKNEFKSFAQALLGVDSAYEQLDKNSKEIVQKFINNTDFSKFQNWDEVSITIHKLINNMDNDKVRQFIEEIQKLNPQSANFREELNKLIVQLSELLKIDPETLTRLFNFDTTKVEKAVEKIKSLAEIQEDLAKSINETSGEIEQINRLLEEHSRTGEWDEKTILSLAQTYPQLISALGNDKKMSQELIKIKGSLKSTVLSGVKAELNAVKAVVSSYGIDAEALLKSEKKKNEIVRKAAQDRFNIRKAEYESRKAEVLSELNRLGALGSNRNSDEERDYWKYGRLYREYMHNTPQFSIPKSMLDSVDKLFELNRLVNETDKLLNNIGTSKSTSSSGSTSNLNIKLDRYQKLNSAIQDVNNALEKNKILQEQKTGVDKIALLTQEIDLMVKKRDLLLALNAEQIKEKEEIRKQLANAGFKFNGDDLLNPELLNSKANSANKVKNSDAKKKAQDAVKVLEEAMKRYEELTHNVIANTQNDWLELGNAIEGVKDTIRNVVEEQTKLMTDLYGQIENAVRKMHEMEQNQKKLDKLKKDLADWQKDDSVFGQSKAKQVQEQIDEMTEDEKIKAEAKNYMLKLKTAEGQQEVLDLLLTYNEEYQNVGGILGTSFADVFVKKIKDAIKQMADLINSGYVSEGEIKIPGLKSGGVVDYTGLAMVHGNKGDEEIMLGSYDAKKLWGFIKHLPIIPIAPKVPIPKYYDIDRYKRNEATFNNDFHVNCYTEFDVNNAMDNFTRALKHQSQRMGYAT